MKKRYIVVVCMLVMAMLMTACGGKNALEGKWNGKLDVTKQFEDGIKAVYPELEKYVDFEELVFQIDVSFVEGKMALQVRQESIDAFDANFAKGMQKIAVEYWIDGLAKIDMSLEEAISESGMTEEQYLARIYRETSVDKMVASMTSVTQETLQKLSNMKGTYTTPVKNELRLYYTENEYESMAYKLKGKQLDITIKGDSFSLLIQCEKNK